MYSWKFHNVLKENNKVINKYHIFILRFQNYYYSKFPLLSAKHEKKDNLIIHRQITLKKYYPVLEMSKISLSIIISLKKISE